MKTLALLLALGGALAGCNTMRGFGQDLEKVGSKIENSADKHK